MPLNAGSSKYITLGQGGVFSEKVFNFYRIVHCFFIAYFVGHPMIKVWQEESF
jgi:hypothetical protein